MPDEQSTPQRHYSRPDPDWSDEERYEWAMAFVESILGPPEIEDVPGYPGSGEPS